MNITKMLRVSKHNPCPICGKPDWCLVAEDGSVAICPHMEEGSAKRCGDAGYLHILKNRHNGHRQSARKRQLLKSTSIGENQQRDFGQLARQYQQQLSTEKLDVLTDLLGVSAQSLKRLNIGWDGKAYTFPISNDFGKIIGIQRRFPTGRKISVRASKIGLFIPSALPSDGLLLLCEGLTDTAAALDLDFAAIGRPSCNSKVEMTANLARGRTVVIVSDNDKVGQTGSKRLAQVLSLYCPSVKIVYPPGGTKDLRQWLIAGLSKEILQELIQKIKPIEIRIGFKD